ncbi:DUF3768 domain-containing protein [Bradyrhizobium manausense]|uniref:DUF3768 domain-containing protein n=1 Tax=Bradyrhizobium manausense TaxID=989370 RepID=UPI00196AB866
MSLSSCERKPMLGPTNVKPRGVWQPHSRGETFGRSTTTLYDVLCEFGSADPGNPEKTTRVLTIILADE